MKKSFRPRKLSFTFRRILEGFVEKVPAGFEPGVTSSFAVAKRPRGASCLSVVNFNSTIRRADC